MISRGQAYEIVCAGLDYFEDGSITSSKRSARHNESVGGNIASKHLTGEAFDLWFDSVQGRERFQKWIAHRGFSVKEYPESPKRLHVQSVGIGGG